MELTNKHRVLPQPWLVESWLSDLSHLGNTAWSTLRLWPTPLRARALVRVYRRPARLTLLVTDLVGFSTLVTMLGDRAAHRLIKLHNTILRACLKKHAGREVAHTGDGIIAAFTDPVSAAQCAIDILHCLEAQRSENPSTPLQVRIGLHNGRPIPEEGRLFGSCVNFAVRICNAADAGQILISDSVRALIARQSHCRECPPVSLKGFTGSHRLHALEKLTLV